MPNVFFDHPSTLTHKFHQLGIDLVRLAWFYLSWASRPNNQLPQSDTNQPRQPRQVESDAEPKRYLESELAGFVSKAILRKQTTGPATRQTETN